MILKKGNIYNIDKLECKGWIANRNGFYFDPKYGEYEGYQWVHYFDKDNRYLGPDKHGIEPLFEFVSGVSRSFP